MAETSTAPLFRFPVNPNTQSLQQNTTHQTITFPTRPSSPQIDFLPTPVTQPKPIGAPPIPKRTCIDCHGSFDETAYFFKRRGQYYIKKCHDCFYKERVARGEKPKYHSMNGREMTEYHKEQADQQKLETTKKRQAEKTPNKERKPATASSPWLKIDTSQFGLQSSPPPPQPSSFSEPAVSSASPSESFEVKESPAIQTQPKKTISFSDQPTKVVKTFDLQPALTKDRDGVVTLTMNDYLKMDPKRVVSRRVPEAQEGPYIQGPPAPIEEKGFLRKAFDYINPFAEEEPTEGEQPELQQTDEEDEMDADDVDFDPRHELYKKIKIYPKLAGDLQLTFNDVHNMSDLDAYKHWETFEALKQLSSYSGLAHAGLTIAAGFVEGVVNTSERTKHRFDLTGYQQEIRDDPDIKQCLNEFIDENEELFDGFSPELRLAALMFMKAAEVNFRNKGETNPLSKIPGVNGLFNTQGGAPTCSSRPAR